MKRPAPGKKGDGGKPADDRPQGEGALGSRVNLHRLGIFVSIAETGSMSATAEKFGLTREQLDAFGKQSQDRAAVAWAEGRFDTQIVPIEAPTRDEDGEVNGTQTITRGRARRRRRGAGRGEDRQASRQAGRQGAGQEGARR